MLIFLIKKGLYEIVQSGAKGTDKHVEEFCKSLKETDDVMDDEFIKKLVDGFNNYVDKGNEIKQEGMTQFKYLQGFVNIIYNKGNLMSNDYVLVENIDKGTQDFSSFMLNVDAVEYTMDSFVESFKLEDEKYDQDLINNRLKEMKFEELSGIEEIKSVFDDFAKLMETEEKKEM